MESEAGAWTCQKFLERYHNEFKVLDNVYSPAVLIAADLEKFKEVDNGYYATTLADRPKSPREVRGYLDSWAKLYKKQPSQVGTILLA